jgi:hypothetical protein
VVRLAPSVSCKLGLRPCTTDNQARQAA